MFAFLSELGDFARKDFDFSVVAYTEGFFPF
jgi:hypothetical protein